MSEAFNPSEVYYTRNHLLSLQARYLPRIIIGASFTKPFSCWWWLAWTGSTQISRPPTCRESESISFGSQRLTILSLHYKRNQILHKSVAGLLSDFCFLSKKACVARGWADGILCEHRASSALLLGRCCFREHETIEPTIKICVTRRASGLMTCIHTVRVHILTSYGARYNRFALWQSSFSTVFYTRFATPQAYWLTI